MNRISAENELVIYNCPAMISVVTRVFIIPHVLSIVFYKIKLSSTALVNHRFLYNSHK